jgi:hypothetical protein
MPPLGLLLVQGGCLPTQLRSFLETDQVGGSSDSPDTPSETIGFRVLQSDRLGEAVTEVSTMISPRAWTLSLTLPPVSTLTGLDRPSIAVDR